MSFFSGRKGLRPYGVVGPDVAQPQIGHIVSNHKVAVYQLGVWRRSGIEMMRCGGTGEMRTRGTGRMVIRKLTCPSCIPSIDGIPGDISRHPLELLSGISGVST